ncbi:MAG: molybdopterin-dependent oxidoreductase [Actinomycetota bacterium]|nr:molybdopterin-dependent oxidoreductase [Actinomycetota bacterium]
MSTTAIAPAPPSSAPVAIRRTHAVLIEVVSIAASVGVGHLVAGIFSPLSSPFQAVADTVVRLSPAWLTEIGKSLDFPSVGLPKGVADKVLLLVGIATALVVLGVLAGLAAHRSRSLGRAVIIVLGLVGMAAVVFSPVFGPADLLAPLVALLGGLSVYFRLYNQAEGLAAQAGGPSPAGPSPAGSPPADPSPAGLHRNGSEAGVELTRRKLIVSSAVVGAGAVGAGAVGQLLGAGGGPDTAAREALRPLLQPARPAPPIPAGVDFTGVGTPTYITSNRDFYRIDTALRIPLLNTKDYRLRMHGMVARELNLTYDELLRRPLEERVVTLACVSNPINGDLISNASFTGVSLRDLLLEAGVQPGADQIFATSHDGWTCGTPTDVVMEPDRGAMLALAMNGEPLPVEHGYPVRVVVPGLYGFVSATKWLTDLELTTFDRRRAYWLDRGWAEQAPIKTASRIDRPRGLDTVPAGRVTAAGIAWAQPRGIARVEVRLDGGAWQQAQLAEEFSRDAWRMWRADLRVPPGNHFIECRATDGAGTVQTEERVDPVPDGATGWPMVTFIAR